MLDVREVTLIKEPGKLNCFSGLLSVSSPWSRNKYLFQNLKNLWPVLSDGQKNSEPEVQIDSKVCQEERYHGLNM